MTPLLDDFTYLRKFSAGLKPDVLAELDNRNFRATNTNIRVYF